MKEQGMQQGQITPEAIAQWQEDTAARIAAGWKAATIRGQLAGSGCPPELIERLLREADAGERKGSGRAGRVAVAVGIGLVLVGLAIVLIR